MSHTPGPWRLIDGKSEVIAGDCYHVAFVKAWFPEHVEQQQANARLIAAAPEMFRLLHGAATCGIMGQDELNDLSRQCRELISRVTDADQTSAREGD